eukprot:71347_1
MLKRSVIQQYHRYGYAILPYKLHETVLNELNSALHEIQSIADSNKNIRYTPQYDLDSNGNLCKIKRPHQWHPAFKSLLYNPFITNIVNNLLNDPSISPPERVIDSANCGIRYQGFKFNIKPAYNGQSILLHQDFAYYPHSNDHLCTISIPLVDMSLDNGTLIFVPKSHLDPMYSHHYNNEFVGGIYELPNGKNINDFDIHSIECSAGDIMVHHTRILHGSVINKSNTQRPLLLMQYASNDSWPLSQNVKGSFGYELPKNNRLDEWDLYESTIITGKPTYNPYLKHIPSLSLPLPWPKRNTFGSVYDQQSKVINGQNIDWINQINYDKVTVIKSDHNHDNIIISPPLLPKVSSKLQINAIYNLKNENDLWKRLVYFVSIGPFGLLEDEEYTDLRLELQNVFINATENNKYDDLIYDSVYEYFHSNIMSDERFKNKLTRFNHYNNRVKKRSDAILDILESIHINNNNCISNILDIGCGDGLITIDVAK